MGRSLYIRCWERWWCCTLHTLKVVVGVKTADVDPGTVAACIVGEYWKMITDPA